MPIRWSALKVSEAADMAEEFAAQLREPAESVKRVAEEALKIPNIPEYIQQGFRSLVSEADRVLGGVYSWNNEPYEGTFDRSIRRIREHLPADSLKAEQVNARHGVNQTLI
jgi:hypothetical protein